MTSNDSSHIRILIETFQELSYNNKLDCFDLHFRIIPFTFPDIDTEISWFTDTVKLAMLTENLYQEIRNKSIYERIFVEDNHTIKFSIKPASPAQRIQYNTFLLSKFLSGGQKEMDMTESIAKRVDEPALFIKEKLKKINLTVGQIRQQLHNRKAKPAVKQQFLRVFYTGFSNFSSGKKISIHIRHKFVELYLYSHGIFIASHIRFLQHLLDDAEVKTGKEKIALNR